jgi:hypothetical protein
MKNIKKSPPKPAKAPPKTAKNHKIKQFLSRVF